MAGKKPDKKPFGRDSPPRGYPKNQSVYADPENWRYPLHTPWHAKAARRYFDEQSNRGKYSEEEQEYIDTRINEALKKLAKVQPSTKKLRPNPRAPSSKKVETLSLEQLLRIFLGPARLQRAKEIDQSLVSVSVAPPERIEGTVKEYVVKVDFKNRTILHDCQDWRNNMESKSMCKHLGKVMLSLPEEMATGLLRQILLNKNEWTFTAPEAKAATE